MSQFIFSKHKTEAAVAVAVEEAPVALARWRILVVDDEPEVHEVTRLALRKLRFKERGVELLSAYSAAEGYRVLAENPDVAVVLLDVVMESEDAGLLLVQRIRRELRNQAVRIVLRTGQPGQAPEQQVIIDYDINDYKAKTELTAERLFTTTIAALRAHEDILALDANRRGLEAIIEASDSLLQIRSMSRFASGVLTQLGTMLESGTHGILCAQCCNERPHEHRAPHVLAASGRFSEAMNRPLSDVVTAVGAEVAQSMERCLASRSSHYGRGYSCLFIGTSQGGEMTAYLDSDKRLSEIDCRLIELFCSKISVGFANIRLFEGLREANALLEQRVAERTAELLRANEELARLASHDSLTGVYNRRALLQWLEEESVRARSEGSPLSLLMVDLDHFKAINDTHGHLVGDEALKAVVAVLAGQLPPAAHMGRYGGEEFAIVLPRIALAEALGLANRLCAAVAGAGICAGAIALGVTVSIGCGQLGADEAVESLIKRVDDALYEAKSGGRNRVVSRVFCTPM